MNYGGRGILPVGANPLGPLQPFAESVYHIGREACGGETSIVVEGLRRYMSGKVSEQCHKVVGTVGGAGVAQRGHLVGVCEHVLHARDAAAGCRQGWGLGHRVDAHVPAFAVYDTETPCYGLKQGLGIRHIVVPLECALSRDVCQSGHGTPLLERILAVKHVEQLVEGEG